MEPLKKLTNGSNTYFGRDACIRLIAYLALFLYGLVDNVSQTHWLLIVSNEFSKCRIITRFFDDIPAVYQYLVYYKSYTKRVKDKEEDASKRYLHILNMVNFISLIFYNPFEHIAWFADAHVVNANGQLWWCLTNISWALALATSVLLNLHVILVYNRQASEKSKMEDSKTKSKKSLLVSKSQMHTSAVVALRDAIDFILAVSYLPRGFLWSSSLTNVSIGLLGIVSSVCRIPHFVYID